MIKFVCVATLEPNGPTGMFSNMEGAAPWSDMAKCLFHVSCSFSKPSHYNCSKLPSGTQRRPEDCGRRDFETIPIRVALRSKLRTAQ